MQAVILAGGFGTRLAHIVKDVPKPMAPINGKPFLAYQIEQLRSNGFDNFILLTGYLSEVIERYFENFSDVKCLKETIPLGTGGAILNAYEHLEDDFWVINGDTFFDIDFSIMKKFAEDKNAVIALRYSEDIARYGFVDIDDDFLINNFTEKGCLPQNWIDGYINGGIYYFKKKLLAEEYDNFKNSNISLESTLFPKFLAKNAMFGLPMGGAFIDIGIPEDYARAQTYIPSVLTQPKMPAIFVDKDGTLIEDTGYPHGKKIVIIEKTLERLQQYQDKGYLFFMVTNQAGIAKNKFSKDEMKQNICAIKEYYAQKGLVFNDVRFCPYHPEGSISQYCFVSKARKPEAGMILSLCENYRIDLKNSVMIGDNPLTDNIKLPYLKSIIIGDQNV